MEVCDVQFCPCHQAKSFFAYAIITNIRNIPGPLEASFQPFYRHELFSDTFASRMTRNLKVLFNHEIKMTLTNVDCIYIDHRR